MRAISLLFASLLTLTACGGGGDTLDEPYGPVAQLEMETPDGVLKVDISPWADADVSTTTQMEQRRKTIAKGEKLRAHENESTQVDLGDSVWLMTRELKPKRRVPRLSKLYGCDYDAKSAHVRFIDAYGPAAFFERPEDDPGMKQLNEAIKDACAQKPARAKAAAITRAITTKPGKGNARAMLKHYVHQEVDGRSGDFMVIDEYSYAMMKNGWAYKNPGVPLDDLDAKRARELQPDRWVKWRKKGGKFQIKSGEKGSKWVTLKGRVNTVKPAKRNKRYVGKFQHVRTTGSMAYNSSSTWRHYTFDKQGNYTSSRSSLGGSGTMASIFPDMGSFTHASTCDETGGSSASSMLHPVVTIGTSKAIDGCGDGKAGTYHVKGYTIELTANNGNVQRLPFFQQGKRTLFIGSRGYWQDTDD